MDGGPAARSGRTNYSHHAGNTASWMRLAQTKSGRYPKELPTRLLTDYHEALTGSETIGPRDEFGLGKSNHYGTGVDHTGKLHTLQPVGRH